MKLLNKLSIIRKESFYNMNKVYVLEKIIGLDSVKSNREKLQKIISDDLKSYEAIQIEFDGNNVSFQKVGRMVIFEVNLSMDTLNYEIDCSGLDFTIIGEGEHSIQNTLGIIFGIIDVFNANDRKIHSRYINKTDSIQPNHEGFKKAIREFLTSKNAVDIEFRENFIEFSINYKGIASNTSIDIESLYYETFFPELGIEVNGEVDSSIIKAIDKTISIISVINSNAKKLGFQKVELVFYVENFEVEDDDDEFTQLIVNHPVNASWWNGKKIEEKTVKSTFEIEEILNKIAERYDYDDLSELTINLRIDNKPYILTDIKKDGKIIISREF